MDKQFPNGSITLKIGQQPPYEQEKSAVVDCTEPFCFGNYLKVVVMTFSCKVIPQFAWWEAIYLQPITILFGGSAISVAG